ncbi:hypothetical protein VZT92_002095 [Zoarces viviparus]|uniref:SGNH hydrolase-type esterase domain-containing protein n=1 Tax=Zoarces viviparus TaxID=48416 RepID=A0AAW1G474_ZOAVI
MAPLTSPSDCVSCARLVDKITELEGRISTLYRIQYAESLMDTVIIGPAQTDTASDRVHDSIASSAAAAAPPPVTAPEASWLRLGAKPKALVSSTPSHHEPWSVVSARSSRRGRHRSPAPHGFNIQLKNGYDALALNDFPPLARDSQLPTPSQLPPRGTRSPGSSTPVIPEPSSRPWTRRSIPCFTPAPRRASVPRSLSPGSSTPPPLVESSPPTRAVLPPRPLFAPTTLIVGDSIIRNTRFYNAEKHCFRGATAKDILLKLPDLLLALPSSIRRIIVHVGINDTALHQSELTKMDFTKLINFLNSCGLPVFISGPTPTLGRGSERFSRILSLHTCGSRLPAGPTT